MQLPYEKPFPLTRGRLSGNCVFQGQLTDSITFLWFLFTVSLALWRRTSAAPAWLLMPSLRAKKIYTCVWGRVGKCALFRAQFFTSVGVGQQNALQRNQNAEAGWGSQCETKSLFWSSVRLSYRVLVTWISFGKKKFVWKIVLDWGINFPWFDVDKMASGLFIPQLRF